MQIKKCCGQIVFENALVVADVINFKIPETVLRDSCKQYNVLKWCYKVLELSTTEYVISKHLSCRQLKNDELVLLSVVFKSSVLHLPLRVKILTAPELVQNQSDFV